MTDDNARSDGGLTREECKRIVERHVEVMTYRKLEEDLRLAHTIEVGQMLNRLKDG
jgi:hypothetical protein